MNYPDAETLARKITGKSNWFAMPHRDEGGGDEDWQVVAKLHMADGTEGVAGFNDATMEAAQLLNYIGWFGGDDVPFPVEPDGTGWARFIESQKRGNRPIELLQAAMKSSEAMKTSG